MFLSNLADALKKKVIWLTYIWSIKKHHNYAMFGNHVCLTCIPLDMIKVLFWSWIRSKVKDFLYDFYE